MPGLSSLRQKSKFSSKGRPGTTTPTLSTRSSAGSNTSPSGAQQVVEKFAQGMKPLPDAWAHQVLAPPSVLPLQECVQLHVHAVARHQRRHVVAAVEALVDVVAEHRDVLEALRCKAA